MSALITSTVLPQASPAHRPVVLRWIARWWLLLILALTVAGFSVLRHEMLSANNVVTVLRSASLLAIMILGLTWVTAAGKLDVSFVQITALANMVAAGMLASGSSWLVAGLSGLAVGPVVGFINGILVGVIRLSPLITTIATGGICGSAAAAIGKGTSVRIDDAGLLGQLLGTSFGCVPLVAIIAAALYAIAWWCQEHLTVGRYIYAMAQSEEAVLEAGVPTGRLIVILYTMTGIFAAAAGVLLVASLASGQPMIGASYFIDGFTAVLVGGMMIRLGQPNVIGTAVAILLLATLVSGGALLGWPDYQRDVLKGVLLIVGVALSVYMGRRSQPSARESAGH
jgi:ribose transport system permease protein